MSIPNLITLGRILLVPVVVWAIASGLLWLAFLLFLAAGVSDAVDGYLAKRFGMTTVLVVPDGTQEVIREDWEMEGRDAAHVDHVTDDLAGFLARIATP